MPGVVDDVVPASGARGEAAHGLLDESRYGCVEGVHRLARLEVDVGVLRGPTNERSLGRQRAPAMLPHERLRYEGREILVGEQFDGVELVRGAKAVEEMEEGDARRQRRHLGDRGEVVGLLHRGGGEEGDPALASGHHVGVVAEDRERLRGERSGRDVEHGRRQFAGDLVQVGDHE